MSSSAAEHDIASGGGAHAHPGLEADDYLGAPHTYASVGEKIERVVLTTKVPKLWPAMIALGMIGSMSLMYAVGVLLMKGVGAWGNNVPVGWAFDIIN
ncbi:MAG TPA: hypothetical protein VF796_03565, partial [Humisphaera sp.]